MTRLLLIAAAMTACLVVACVLTSSSRDPRTNIAYWAWRAHLAPFSSNYIAVIPRDGSHWIGMPIEEFRGRVAVLHDGAGFPRDSYRGGFAWERRGSGEAFYWFDDDPSTWGECVIVKDGRIRDFVSVKG